ncbi:MAG TPA: hypothetical protein VF472_02625 [Burkholderiaceae bacterium]
MHVKICLLALFSGWFSVSAAAADCSTYRGTATSLTKDVSATLDKAFAAVHAHNARNLYALADRKVMLVRRAVSNSQDRSGNIRFELRQRDLDSSLNIRIGNLAMTELSQAGAFGGVGTDNALMVRRDICEDARKCEDSLPGSEQLPFMLNDLLQCNQYAKGVYLYDDGMYAVDMAAAPGKMPLGTALFFSKAGAAYKLAGVVIFN